MVMCTTVSSDNLIPFIRRTTILCPNCSKPQQFEYSRESRIWFQIGGYCCIQMQYDDSTEWNSKLDRALKNE